MAKKIKVVDFGSVNSGLSTVGYTLYNVDGTTKKARTTSGVTEIGSGTGIYAAEIDFPDDWEGILVWDTGGSDPVYATEEYLNQLNNIERESEKIRIIWNTLKNRFDYEAEILNRLKELAKRKGLTQDDVKKALSSFRLKDYTKELSEILKNFSVLKGEFDANFTILKQFNKAIQQLGDGLKEVKNKISSIKIPQAKDYNLQLEELKERISSLRFPEYSEEFENIRRQIENIKFPELPRVNALKSEMDEYNKKMREIVSNFQKQMDYLNKVLKDLYQQFFIISNVFYQQLLKALDSNGKKDLKDLLLMTGGK